jgi:hypothetical protein
MSMITTRPRIHRRLNLADMAILVMATALGLVAIREDLAGLFTRPQSLENGQWVYRWTLPVALSKAITVEMWLTAWSAGWLVIQLRRPRPRLRQLARQPGFVACLSSSIVTLVSGPLTLAAISSISTGANGWLDRIVWGTTISSQIGAAVLAGWALLGVSGRCRLRAGWLDRVGQLVGLFWVAMIPANVFHFFWYCGWSN